MEGGERGGCKGVTSVSVSALSARFTLRYPHFRNSRRPVNLSLINLSTLNPQQVDQVPGLNVLNF